MANYTTNSLKVNNLLKQANELNRSEKNNLLLKLVSSLSRHDARLLVPLLLENGITRRKIAKTLKVDPATITKLIKQNETY